MIRHLTTPLILFFWMGSFTPCFSNFFFPADTVFADNLKQELRDMAIEDAFVVRDLIPGHHYSLLFAVYQEAGCLPDLSMDINHKQARATSRQIYLEFRAVKATETIRFKNPCKDIARMNYFVSSRCDDCPVASAERSKAVISINEGVDADYLVRDVFIGGGCFEVDNITFKGPAMARGTFSQGTASIGIEEGVILATGAVSNAKGPNEDTGTTTIFGSGGTVGSGDSDLQKLLPGSSRQVTDVAILEFDFTPTTDHVSFEYAFASEEYCDYVNSEYNDVFGFFISGPGINGSKNIALIPGSSDNVAINSVNFTKNDQYYRDNTSFWMALTGGCRFGELLSGAVARDEIEYDGFTTVLTAAADVIPCETYHIKLAVGDVGDRRFDSAVFLKANSFDLGDPAVLTAEVPEAVFPDSSLVYESCQESFFVFKRTDQDRSRPLQVPFTLSDKSTATPYDDYAPIFSPITIPAGQDSVKIPLFIYNDNLDEGNETIILELETACTCEGIETTLIIAEPEEFEVNFGTVSTCPGGTVSLSPNIIGGIGEFSYEWSNNETEAIVVETLEEPKTFSVTVTDFCGVVAEATTTVSIMEQTAAIDGAVKDCNGEREGAIEVSFNGSGPFALEYAIDGIIQPVIEDITTNPFVLPESEAGTYEIIKMRSNGCEGEGVGTADFVKAELTLGAQFAHPSCFDSKDGKIDLQPTGTGQTFTYDWNNGAKEEDLQNLEEGVYSVIVSDEEGCQTETEVALIAPETMEATIEAIKGVDCYDLDGGAIDLDVKGGTPGYSYSWNEGIRIEEDPKNLPAGFYEVEVEDANGCVLIANVEIPADTTQPQAFAQANEAISCRNATVNLAGTGTSVGKDFSYSWTTVEGSILSGGTTLSPTVAAPGDYTLAVEDASNGCIALSKVTVQADLEAPELNSTTPNELNCAIEELQIAAQIINDLADIAIDWTTSNGNILSGANTLAPSVDAPGIYRLEATNNANGCSNELQVSVIENRETPAVTISTPLDLTCDRKEVDLEANLVGQEDNFSFSWSTQDGHFLENKNALSQVVDQPGTYTLRVTDTQNFCETTIESIVGIDINPPEINVGEPFVFTCSMTQTQIEANGSLGNHFSYEWTTEDGNIASGSNTLRPTISTAGTYAIVIKNEENGCESNASIRILDDQNRPVAVIETPESLTCIRNEVQLDASNSSQGSTLTYNWETIDGVLSGGVTGIETTASAPGFYTLTIRDGQNDCTTRQTIEVGLDTLPPIASIRAPSALNCKDTELKLDGMGSSEGDHFIYDWETVDGSIIADAHTLSPTINAPGNYALEITNINNGCTTQASLLVTKEVPEDMEMNILDPLCPGDRGEINIHFVRGGIPPYEYSIDGGNNFYKNAQFGQLQPGFYNVIIKDANECSLDEVIEIAQPRTLTVDLEPIIELQIGDSTELDALTNIPYVEIAEISWTPESGLSCTDCMNPTVKPFNSMNYQLNIIDQNGCEASSTVQLVVDATPQIFVPTAFTPDGDGKNDYFTIFAKSSMVNRVTTLQIFSRWGAIVFQRDNFSPNDESLGWDGRFNRQKMRPAVFVYRAELEMVDGRKVQIKGDVALLD